MTYLSKKQEDVLKFIEGYAAENGIAPTIREIGGHFDIQVKAVQDHISAIESKGYLKIIPKKRRGMEILSPSPDIPIYGRVAAGKPILAFENIEGYVPGSSERNTGHFALRVKGDSMIEAGIMEDDIVIVMKQNTARDKDIVIAMLGDEATVKRYRLKQGKQSLEPANPKYETIHTEFEIIGKVIESRRKY